MFSNITITVRCPLIFFSFLPIFFLFLLQNDDRIEKETQLTKTNFVKIKF